MQRFRAYAGLGDGKGDWYDPTWGYEGYTDDGYLPPTADGVARIGVTTDSGRIYTAADLAKAIKASGGKLRVAPSSSALIIAMNNSLRFETKEIVKGQLYEIKDRLAGDNTTTYALLGGAALLLVVVLASK